MKRRILSIESVTLIALSVLCHPTDAGITEIGSGTGYTFGLSSSRQFGVIQVEATEYDDWLHGPSTSQRRLMTSRVLDHLPDAFDMVVFVADEPMGIPGVTPYGGIHSGVSNDIMGLGRPLFDNTSLYGSAGRLQSQIYLTSYRSLRSSLLHEITHRWANALDDIPSPPQFSGHFGYSSVGGVLGGWEPGTLSMTGSNQYDADGPGGTNWFGIAGNGPFPVNLSPLELYLAGFIAPEEVPDIEVAVNPQSINVGVQGTFEADEIITLTIEDIISTEGARSPDFTTSQNQFELLTVVITDDPSSQYTAEAENTLDNDLYLFSLQESDQIDEIGRSANFWEATGGRAAVSFSIPGILGDFNGDGTIDAADYTVWLDALGGTTLLNDPTPGTVDQSDYDYWKANFGLSSGTGLTATSNIPEPTTLALLGLAATLLTVGRRSSLVRY